MTSDVLLSVQDILNLKHMIGYDINRVKRGKYIAWRNRYYCSSPADNFERLRRLNICGSYEDGRSIVYYLTEHGFEVLGKILGVKIIEEG